MKRYSSYGPPNPRTEFMVQRPELVEKIAVQLLGTPEDLGHYFTIFAPRQVGKTTTLRQVVTLLRERLGDSFHVGMATMHGIDDFRLGLPTLFKLAFNMRIPELQHWVDVQRLFSVDGPLKKPTILILDEFDALPGPELAQTIATFRQLYLERENTHLHGLALIGVHSVLGELTSSMSPFNIQRSVRVPNLTREEVFDLYGQYIAESGQEIEPAGVERIYDMFRGQPGLTCWFGELLTEKYNRVQPPPWERKDGPPPEGYPLITRAEVERVLNLGQFSEININIRNLISKGLEQKDFLRELFVRHDVRFDLNKPSLQWLYLNGILVGEADPRQPGKAICAFASPFVQSCLFSAFGDALSETYRSLKLVTPHDEQALWDATHAIDVPALLRLYRTFLASQAAKGDPPWSAQPARSDARAFEAIGHFNLYAWLYGVANNRYTVVPEFPTGNGTADLWLMNAQVGRKEVLEVKSFTNTLELEMSLTQIQRYARKLRLAKAYLVVMADVSAYAYLSQQPTQYSDEGLEIQLEVIPWGFVPGDDGALRQPTTDIQPRSDDALIAKSPNASTQRRSRKTVAKAPPALSIEDRLTLADLVVAQLSPPLVQRLWILLGQPFAELPGQDPGVCWEELVSRCVKGGHFLDLLKATAHTCPALRGEALLERLTAAASG